MQQCSCGLVGHNIRSPWDLYPQISQTSGVITATLPAPGIVFLEMHTVKYWSF